MSREVFASCDLESVHSVRQWSLNARGGFVSIPLEMGTVYYFIDSVAGGCMQGRKIQVRNDWILHFICTFNYLIFISVLNFIFFSIICSFKFVFLVH